MRRTAIIFLIVVCAPSLVLAWLAFRSVRDQQFVIERQQALLLSATAERITRDINTHLAELQRAFRLEVESLLVNTPPETAALGFDTALPRRWPLADLGFAVSPAGRILAPVPQTTAAKSKQFLTDNALFLSNRKSEPAYVNYDLAESTPSQTDATAAAQALLTQRYGVRIPTQQRAQRQVEPIQQTATPPYAQNPQAPESGLNPSRSILTEGGFAQFVSGAQEGTLARFVQNQLQLLFWYQPPANSNVVFGAAIELTRLIEELRPFVQPQEPSLGPRTCIALLNDVAQPVALSNPGFQAAWKRPFVAAEIGEMLPHWEIAIYFVDPGWSGRYARTLVLALGPTIVLLVLAIIAGSWIIVRDLHREVLVAQQKTDFVSNVSHELKTPLTSIRMFAELLADGRVTDPARQRDYLGIITAEAARLTRLINNVLDFSRLERGQKKYNFQTCDLAALTRETLATLRPHLHQQGFALTLDLPDTPLPVRADRDALAQVLLNLLSNAEKYAGDRRTIDVALRTIAAPVPQAELRVLDRGIGIPPGCEDKIFDQFYRAHDALSSGIQGSGLGLTLARQIARAHGGDVTCEPRPDGGSTFILCLPLPPNPSSP